MKARGADWYKKCWTLDIKNQSWVEETEKQVDFIIKVLELTGKERILDLACGYGRHALSFARRGYEVTGVDFTKAYIEDAAMNAKGEGLKAQFIQSDIREVHFKDEFDVVLNLADGAIGYLENDAENLKIFDVIAQALKDGGKHFMDICNAEHAEHCFPRRNWEVGEHSIALSQFEWNREERRMLFGGMDIPFEKIMHKPDPSALLYGDPTRLYSIGEIKKIWQSRHMEVLESFSNYDGKEATYEELQLMVYSRKNNSL